MPELTLRPAVESDLSTLWRWTHAEADPEWQRWDGPYFAKTYSSLSFGEYQRKFHERTAPNPHRQIMALDDQCIGMVTRYEEEPAGGGWWELGIVIYDPQYWSGGYGTRALKLWSAATFAETNAHVITLTTWSGNERMIRAAARVGFHECARIPEARLWQGRRWDSVKMALLRSDQSGLS